MVWQGSAGDRRPYADQRGLCCLPTSLMLRRTGSRGDGLVEHAIEIAIEDDDVVGALWNATEPDMTRDLSTGPLLGEHGVRNSNQGQEQQRAN